ncbi:MAG: molybdenum cofactor guanylyltransferase [Bauldia sp.]|nr:molybdenum cofactor guanylyltransferase [Bauldia sp.]
MGGIDKCLLQFGATSLLANAIERLRPQVSALVVNANGDPARFAGFDLPVIADPVPGFAGPLAGILAGMRWAEANAPEARTIATVATDTPFFPIDLVARLTTAAGSPERIAIARTGGRPHFVFGVFPVDYAGALDRHLRTGGSLRVADWLDDIGFTPVDFDDPGASAVDPFFNVNAPEDLTTAQALLRQFGQG